MSLRRFFVILTATLWGLVGFSLVASADCEVIDFDWDNAGILTAAERKAKLDELRIRELSRDDTCEDSSGGGGASSEGSSSQLPPSSGQNAAGLGASYNQPSNILAAGESSIAISSNGQVIKAMLDTGDRGSLSQGADHEALTAVDNIEEMKAQIKAAADAETDPVVREKLMEKYKELSKQ
jgi:hypothetical protein